MHTDEPMITSEKSSPSQHRRTAQLPEVEKASSSKPDDRVQSPNSQLQKTPISFNKERISKQLKLAVDNINKRQSELSPSKSSLAVSVQQPPEWSLTPASAACTEVCWNYQLPDNRPTWIEITSTRFWMLLSIRNAKKNQSQLDWRSVTERQSSWLWFFFAFQIESNIQFLLRENAVLWPRTA